MNMGSNECGCSKCNPNAWWMVVCDICGNKRCPHAENCDYECSNSNEPHQTPILKKELDNQTK